MKDPVLSIEKNWEIIVLIHDYKLKGINDIMDKYKNIYDAVASNPTCPCNKNHIAFLNNIKDNLNQFLTKEEINIIKEKEEAQVIHVKKENKEILEF